MFFEGQEDVLLPLQVAAHQFLNDDGAIQEPVRTEGLQKSHDSGLEEDLGPSDLELGLE